MSVKPTDYARIAAIYDQAAMRHHNPPDAHLAASLERGEGAFRLLDVACGTGNYLLAQMRAYPDGRIAWHGIDASAAMLARAAEKLEGVALAQGRAEALPYADGEFDYLSCNYAFHHFEDKPRALDEMRRVLRPGGALRLTNVAPEHMRRWWVYQVFESSWHEDQRRFWPVERLVYELEERGFEVEAEVRVGLGRKPASEARREAAGRDMSSVAIVGEASFAAGMRRLEEAEAAGEALRNEDADVQVRAIRP